MLNVLASARTDYGFHDFPATELADLYFQTIGNDHPVTLERAGVVGRTPGGEGPRL